MEPILNREGALQAESVARWIAENVPRGNNLFSSPRLRAIQTAEAIARQLTIPVVVDPVFGEAPVPEEFEERIAEYTLGKKWTSIDRPVREWRGALIATLRSWSRDTVVVTHFLAINALVSFARQDDSVVVFSPPKGSVTALDVTQNVLDAAVHLFAPPKFVPATLLGRQSTPS